MKSNEARYRVRDGDKNELSKPGELFVDSKVRRLVNLVKWSSEFSRPAEHVRGTIPCLRAEFGCLKRASLRPSATVRGTARVMV